ncbi:PAS domain-containing sensor histidine kinase [Natronorarus salvus]|uniref:PAS domain-containing sensor histidine kinase n=1 Tax=Natronorarus salvus TaxID=3117733 RepID=UPI002F26AF2C
MTNDLLYIGPDRSHVPELLTTTAAICIAATVDDAIRWSSGVECRGIVCEEALAERPGALGRLRTRFPGVPIVLVAETDRAEKRADDVCSPDDLGEVVESLEGGDDVDGKRSAFVPPLEFTRGVLDRLPDVFFVTDTDGKLVHWNDRLPEVTGYTDEEIGALSPFEFFVEEDRERVERAVEALVEEGEVTVEARLLTSDGAAIDYEFTGSIAESDDSTRYICGVGRDVSGRRRSEHVLREREQALTNLVRNLPGIAHRYRNEPEMPIEFASEGCLDLTGHPYETLESGAVTWLGDLIHPDDREMVREEIESAVRNGEQYRLTYRLVTESEDVKWVREQGQGVEEPDGSVRYIDGYVADISDLIETERRLDYEREKLRSLISRIEEYAIYVLDTRGRVVSWNQGAMEITGYEEREVIGEHVSTFYTREDRDRGHPDRLLAEAVTNGSSEDRGWRVRADGSRYWANALLTTIEEGGELIGFASITRDMTDRKRMEEALREEQAFTEDALDAQQDLFYVFGVDGTVLRWNSRFTEVTGYDDQEIAHMHPAEFVDGEDVEKVVETMAEIVATGETATIEATLVTKAGEEIPYEFTGSVLGRAAAGTIDEGSGGANVDSEDESVYICGIGRDISERLRAERELETVIDELERSNEELERFAYVASHDLKEPLRMIRSYLDLLERRYGDELDEDADEFIGYAVDGAERMQRMIDDLLSYSRIDTHELRFDPVDCEEVFERVETDLTVVIEESDAELTVDSLPTVEGDRDQLTQLFQNLVSNAIKYAGEEPPRIHVSARRDGDTHVIEVSDNGIGIEAERLEEVFEIFTTGAGSSSTGIGLSICEKIATRHGGSITIDSEPGSGTTVSVALPAEQDDITARGEPAVDV